MSKPFCTAPWTSRYYSGTKGVNVCCEWRGEDYFQGNLAEFEESQYLKEIKRKMFDGGNETNCAECIHQESIGEMSSRDWFNEQFEVASGLQQLDYRPGNTCNLMCRMCSPYYSSLIAKESGVIINNLDTSDVDSIDLSKLKKVMVLGGEPSVDIKARVFLEKLARSGTDALVEITTNGTNVSKKWFDLLKQFDNIFIAISIDASGPVFDYIRTLAKWKDISKNLELYHNEFGDDIRIHMTAQTYNYAIIDSWFDYFIDSDIGLEQHPCITPTELSLQALKPKYADIVLEWLDKKNNDKCDAAMKMIKSFEYSKYANQEFISYTRHLDKLRGTNILDIHPRFKEIMQY